MDIDPNWTHVLGYTLLTGQLHMGNLNFAKLYKLHGWDLYITFLGFHTCDGFTKYSYFRIL